MGTKKRITAFVPDDVKQELENGKVNRSLSNHVADILTQHVEKNKPKPYVSKVEYDGLINNDKVMGVVDEFVNKFKEIK